ncbi:hypothetical protein EKO27_g9726 [Xylaria grammica]|uniref:AAA+ ATPase domain-containing protein n=1 Tax=Xylaria grammica TaxID=363999 RepID=A0A439CT97_9PEZI|nr:hypothetical protein EKO27_g9726 [Xylaria grammica]
MIYTKLGSIQSRIKTIPSELWSSVTVRARYLVMGTPLDQATKNYVGPYSKFTKLGFPNVVVVQLAVVYAIYLVILGIMLVPYVIAYFAYRRFVALWCGEGEEESGEETPGNSTEDKPSDRGVEEVEKKSNLPQTIRDKMEAVKKLGGEEAKLIHLIVDSNTVDHGNGNASNASDYGVLKHTRVAGALLYGPPGTGKTHLARVLPRESTAVVISASPTDIEDCWVGKTEKTIKAPFSLGKKLAPSIIFIDEADALLRKRELDPAVLRRVPRWLHMALPSRQLRKSIFEINLRDEILDQDIDTMYLAGRTPGSSGSDIRTLCVQAALQCDIVVTEGDDTGKRILNRAHFVKSLARTPPSTSAPNQHSEVQEVAVDGSRVDDRTRFLHGNKRAQRLKPSMGEKYYSHAEGYQYQSLHDIEHEIRLLHLMPGDFDDPIPVQITHVSLKPPREKKKRRRVTNDAFIINSIKSTLPPPWNAACTDQGKSMFLKRDENGLLTSWQHPDPSFDMSSVNLPPPIGRDECLQGPSFEALSYRNMKGTDNVKANAREGTKNEVGTVESMESGEKQNGEEAEEEGNTYQVVGECVIPGLEDSIRLLGSLPHPWAIKIALNAGGQDVARYRNIETGEITDSGPRLTAPRDEEWEWEWEPLGEDTTALSESSGGSGDDGSFLTCQAFMHKTTGQVAGYDPRLEPEAIEAHGVRLETLTLV